MSAPLQAVDGHLVTGPDAVPYAVYRVRCSSYMSEPRRRQAALAGRLESYLRVAEADLQILRVTRRWDAQAYAAQLLPQLGARGHTDLWADLIDLQQQAIDGLAAWLPAVFICVRLAPPDMDLQGHASRIFERTPRELLKAIRSRSRTRRLAPDELAERERTAAHRISSALGARPATASEVQWLVRRSFTRGLGEPAIAPQDPQGARVARWLSEDGVTRYHRHVVCSSEMGESYQTGFCLGEMDCAAAFSRASELMFTPIEEHPFAIDACLQVRWVPNDQALRRAHHHMARTSHQLEDEAAGPLAPTGGAVDVARLAGDLQDRLAATGEPLLMGTLSFMLGAPSLEDLQRQARTLRESFPWPLYRPLGDQLDVWQSHLPAQRSVLRGFERPWTCEQAGHMVPHATHEAGSDTSRALYIGHTLHGRKPVLFDLQEGSQSNRSPAVALLGSLGGGKTVFLQTLAYQAFLQGFSVVDVDPKGDHRFHLLPEVAPHAQVIELGPDERHAGKLDPLRVAPAAERHDSACSFLLDCLPPNVDPPIHAAISGAVTRTIDRHGERACCRAVLDELVRSDDPDDKRAGMMLSRFADGGLVRLGFASLADPLPARAEKQVTYLMIRALRRTELTTARSEMSQAQRHGRAALQLVSLYSMRILGTDRAPKLLSFDEGSFLTADDLGRQHLDTVVRWCRSENIVPIVSTQLLRDVSEQDNLFGWQALFSMRSRAHARQALELLGLQEPDAPDCELVTTLTERLGDGRCLLRDLHGRTELVQIDLASRRLLAALDTKPAAELQRVSA